MKQNKKKNPHFLSMWKCFSSLVGGATVRSINGGIKSKGMD